LSSSIVPGAGPGVALHFSAQPGAHFGLAVGALYLSPSRASTAAGNIQIGLSAATLGATFEAARFNAARLVLEGGAWAGMLQTAVLSPAPADSGPYAFLAVDLGAHAQLAISRVLFAEVGGALGVPLVRRGLFVARVEQPLWREPALGGLGFFGVGASFP